MIYGQTLVTKLIVVCCTEVRHLVYSQLCLISVFELYSFIVKVQCVVQMYIYFALSKWLYLSQFSFGIRTTGVTYLRDVLSFKYKPYKGMLNIFLNLPWEQTFSFTQADDLNGNHKPSVEMYSKVSQKQNTKPVILKVFQHIYT